MKYYPCPPFRESEQMARVVSPETRNLLDRAKSILSRWDRLHSLSVDIGRFEKISDSGVVDSEIGQCRRIIEQADRLCADIDRQVSERPTNTETDK